MRLIVEKLDQERERGDVSVEGYCIACIIRGMLLNCIFVLCSDLRDSSMM